MAEEIRSSQKAASAQQDLCEILDTLESNVLDLLKERDQLRKKVEELGQQPSIRQPKRSKRRSTARKASRSSAKQKRAKKSDPIEKPAVKTSAPPDGSEAAKGTRNALGRTLAQLRLNRDRGHE